MKKIFSVKKFEEEMKLNGAKKRKIQLSIKMWANACDGLTEEEMWAKHGLLTHDKWMIEVD